MSYGHLVRLFSLTKDPQIARLAGDIAPLALNPDFKNLDNNPPDDGEKPAPAVTMD